jgi:NAD(P)-dependent dehydrogenase (short-subunit alcohol dehydrogenase family)
MFDITDKMVLITGADQGFGRVCTLAFAARGARHALCDINDGPCHREVDDLGRCGVVRCHGIATASANLKDLS